jgi:oligopeptide transport system permease protein
MSSEIAAGITAPTEGPQTDQTASKGRTFGRDAVTKLLRNPVFLLSLAYLVVVFWAAAFPSTLAGLFGHGDPWQCNLAYSALPPQPGHPFGYDIQGCDLYANVVYGARPSIVIGLTVTAVSTVIAVTLGTVAGYLGGWVDVLYGRITDIFYGFPYMVAAIVLLTLIGNRSVMTVAMVLAAFSWPHTSRLMRGQVLSTKTMDYVQAARALGASRRHIMRRHIIPNSISPVLVTAALSIGGTIAGEAGLTFIGVGLRMPTISWGLQLSTAQKYFISSPHLLIYPALVLTLTVIAFTLIGDAISEALDPKRH